MNLMNLNPVVAATLIQRRQVAKQVSRSPRFVEQIEKLAKQLKLPVDKVAAEALKGLEEIVTVQSPAFAAMFDYGLGPLHTRAWTVDADLDALANLKKLNETKALVYLPTHRSYADAFILSRLLRDNGLARNHILGGNNLGFWPLGTIIRRSGGILIRRSFQDDEIYKLVVREYLAWLASQRKNLEWYMEGGRSRTGKLRPPKYGLLSYLVSAIESGGADDMLLVPVSTTYDQMHEIGVMAAEEAGAAKAKENLLWLAGYARTQQKLIGNAYVRFGEPLSLREALARADAEGGGKWTVAKIAFEVFQRINRATPVTANALVTLALLGVRDRALTLDEVHELVLPLLDYAEVRGLPSTHLEDLQSLEGVEITLGSLVDGGVISRYDGGTEVVYAIEPGQHSVAAFYRNSAVHWFINRAVFEVALLDTSKEDDLVGPLERAWQSAFELRDLLKFDFFFSDKAAYREEQKAESRLFDAKFRQRAVTVEGRKALLLGAPFLIAHRVLTPFIEAYFIVADRLAAQAPDAKIDKKKLTEECVKVGRQYVLQKRLSSPECVSREVFGNALSLAANRDLLKPGSPDLAARRQAFADELASVVERLAAIEKLDQARHAAAHAVASETAS
ncbi:1-acyl-sn-glycerol-3-phosphate acyltransferase [Nevskia sp.]|uniref:1-acyl-sn-glycerol-3-phosphate acyltransferase n=1 Tax=Nevskia sp. TaxID=1929292 RepID=UPI0025FA1954|nr:1-acyl-sn-glycerol-3-phosphate acyltransferase [Nevskia sp.]